MVCICETLPDVLERGRFGCIGDEKILLLFSELWDLTMASWRPMRIVLLRTYLRRLCYGKRYVWPWRLTGLSILFVFATLLFYAALDVRRQWGRSFHTKEHVTSTPHPPLL